MASSSSAVAKPDRKDSRPTQRRKVKRQLNVRLLVGTLIAVVVLGPSAYFWREFQVRRTAGAFLDRADALKEEPAKAASYLYRYLQLRPDDANVIVSLAETFGESAAGDDRLKPRAVNLYYRALGVASEEQQPALRSSLTDLLLETRQFVAAVEEAGELLEANPDDPQGLRVLALAHYGLYLLGSRDAKSDDGTFIGEEFERALQQDPGNIGLAGALAQIYRTQPLLLSEEKQALTEGEREKLADAVMDRMVEANAEEVTAYLSRYLYRNEYELAGAKEDLETALRITPDSVGVLLLAAEHDRQEALRVLREEGLTAESKKAADEHLTAASEYYTHILDDIAPKDERAHMGLGDILSLRGKADEAIEKWQKGLAAGNANSILLNLRLAGALLAQGRIEPAEEAVIALSAGVDELIAALPRPTRLSLERSINMLKGRCFAAKREFPRAIAELKRVLAGRASSEAEVRQTLQAEMLLGRIYASMSELDLSVAAFERAATLKPDTAIPRLAAAGVSARFKPETAIRHYEIALAMGDSTSVAGSSGQAITGVQWAEAWFALARARFQRQKKLPEDDRNWKKYLEAIEASVSGSGEAALPNAWRADLVQADYLALLGEQKGDRQQGLLAAVQQLRRAAENHPDSESFLLALVLGYEQFGASEDADRAVEKLEDLTGKSATTYLLRSRLHSLRKEPDKAREILEQGLEALPAEDHLALNRALAQISLRTDDVEVAQGKLLALHEKDPTNRGLILQLLELAFQQNDLPSVTLWELKLREVEGPNSPYADYCKVRRLLAGATDEKGVTDQQDPNFAEGVKLLSDLKSRLPNSRQIHMLQGMVLQAQGERQGAIEAYQNAIRLGMHTAAAYERLIAALGDEGRFDEARTYFTRAKGRGITSQRLNSLEMVVAVGDGQLDEAERLARAAAAENPDSATAKLNEAQILLAAKKPEEAKSAFQEAIRRAPTDIRTYAALFNFYLQKEHKDLARQTLQELEENVDLTPGKVASVLAESYERLGDVEKAETHYRRAQELESQSTVNQMRLADFLTRNDKKDEAETILRNILQKNPEVDAARYRLADILVARGGQEEWQAALKLLEQSRTDENVFHLDRRLQALLLIRRAGSQNLAKARELLEGLVLNAKEPADADRLLLAQVYEAEIARLQPEDDPDGAKAEKLFLDARKQYTEVVGQAKPNPSHLALFVEFLIRSDKAGSASGYLDRLEKLTPDNLGTMRLRARWLNSEDRTEEIKPLVEALAEKLLEKIVDDPKTEVRLALEIGGIYLGVQLHQEAERWYRRLIELDPTVYAPLVTVLTRQDRMKDAIDVCTEAAQADKSARPAALLASLLVEGKASEEECQQAEAVLNRAVEDHPDDVTLLLGMANLRVSQKQMDEAAKLYRLVLKQQPRHLVALNNLATLLSELPEQSEEALRTIDLAIDIAGEQAAFLDTKGMTLVHSGKPGDAVPLLEKAAFSTNSDARYHFHLAVAHIRNGDLDKASESLQEANRGDLESQFLTEVDLELLAELQEKLQK